jgi:hypothetical protein
MQQDIFKTVATNFSKSYNMYPNHFPRVGIKIKQKFTSFPHKDQETMQENVTIFLSSFSVKRYHKNITKLPKNMCKFFIKFFKAF